MNKDRNKINYLTYKGYIGDIEFSLTDNCLFGKVLGLSKGLISYEGQTLKDLKKDFKNGIDDYLSHCKENNIEPQKPFSGQFSIRLNPELHRLVVATAQQQGITVNRFVRQAVEHELRLNSSI